MARMNQIPLIRQYAAILIAWSVAWTDATIARGQSGDDQQPDTQPQRTRSEDGENPFIEMRKALEELPPKQAMSQVGRILTKAGRLSPTRVCERGRHELIEISRLEWQILQTRLDLLTLSVSLGEIIRLEYTSFNDPQLHTEGLTSLGGYYYWPFTYFGDLQEIHEYADMILKQILRRMPGVHANAHCIVITFADSNKEIRKIYLTVDRSTDGNLKVSVHHQTPVASATRRDEIANMFKELETTRKRLKELWDDDTQTAEPQEVATLTRRQDELEVALFGRPFFKPSSKAEDR